MIKNVNVNELLFSDLLVKDAVNDVNSRLTGDDKRGKFILTGGRGSGKSTVLVNRENDGLKTKHPAVLVRFDGAGLFGTKDNDYFNKRIMGHYYEVLMCHKFLEHIKEFYPDLYFARFTRFEDLTRNRLYEIDNYINNALYKKVSIDHKLFSGEMLSEILSLFRQGTNAETVTLMIDRFDWTHNSDPRVQDILRNYFSMFEKVIVTSDDPTIMSDKKKKVALEDRGFGFEVVDYGRDLDTVVEIVQRRFDLDSETHPKFPIDDLESEDYQELIRRCDGNLELMLNTFMYAETLHKWDSKRDASTVLSDACCQRVKDEKQYRKMVKPPKFHV